MKLKHLLMSAGVLVAGVATLATVAQAQGPLYDKVIVNLPYQVTINDKTLEPGQYVIRQVDSQSGQSRVLQIFSDRGMKLETAAMTIPALDNNTPENTKVILHHYGPDYYFDKIWIQGKNYGYEFPLPDSVKSREKERLQPYTVAARYESVNQSGVTQNESNASASVTTTTPAPAVDTTTQTSSTETTVQTQTQTQADTSATVAQNTAPVNVPVDTTTTTDNTRTMPHTATNWAGFVLSGGLLAAFGILMLRRLTA